MNKVLVSPSSFGEISREPLDALHNSGFEVLVNPYGRKLTEDEVISLGQDCIGIVAGVEPLNENVLSKIPTLKCISRVGVGMDSVDIEYAQSKGITVVNTPNGPTRAVAELALGLGLSLLRLIPQANRAIHSGDWKKFTGNLLYGKTIGIIGLGRIGKMVAENFLKLGNTVVGYDLYPDKIWAETSNVSLLSLDSVMQEGDLIYIHVPGSTGGIALIGERELKLMKSSAYLINLSRGGVVCENALEAALRNKLIKGAAIDVFAHEPYIGGLQGLDNVILTPHMGSYAEEGKLQMEIDAVIQLYVKDWNNWLRQNGRN
jgi:D-3-phosphoglycerate dehydrogenase